MSDHGIPGIPMTPIQSNTYQQPRPPSSMFQFGNQSRGSGIGKALGGIGALLGGPVGAIAGMGLNAILQGGQNRKNRAFQREMYGQQRRDALTDRDYMNAYNSPTQQRQRLEDAGLNAALMYGGPGS